MNYRLPRNTGWECLSNLKLSNTNRLSGKITRRTSKPVSCTSVSPFIDWLHEGKFVCSHEVTLVGFVTKTTAIPAATATAWLNA